jgi:uncharacterized protein DUF3465
MMRAFSLVVAVAAAIAGCAASNAPDNAAALADIRSHRGGEEVVVEGPVTSVFPSQSGESGTHERFVVRVGSGAAAQDVLVADNITVGSAAPVHPGDDVIVKGVLEVDASGPVIHWTHHDPRYRHAGGFVMLDGKKYD